MESRINVLNSAEIPEFMPEKDSASDYEDKLHEELVKISHIKRREGTPGTVALREGWTTEELRKFTDGLRQHDKDFWAIKQKFLPQRDVTEIVEFYYRWKRSNKVKGQQQSRAKMVRYMAAKISSADVGFDDSVASTGKFTRSKRKALESSNGSV